MVPTIAVTGGIAVGKSVLMTYWHDRYDVEILDTDLITQSLLYGDLEVLSKIIAAFGKQVLTASGKVDKVKLQALVFSDLSKKAILESIIHPLVRRQVALFRQQAVSRYVLVEIPLVVETGSYVMYDRVLVVDSPYAKRLGHCSDRGLSKTMSDAIIRTQASRWARFAVADDIVYNFRDLNFLYRQVDRLAGYYRKMY